MSQPDRLRELQAAGLANLSRQTLARRVFENSPVGLLVFDRELRLLDVNETAERLLELPRGQAPGQGLAAFDPDLAGRLEPLLHRALAGDRVPITALRRTAGDNTEQFFDGQLAPVPDQAGNPEAVLAVLWCAEAPPPARPETAGGRLILLVEDNQDLRDTLTDLLQMVGQRVLAAPDGASALALAEARRPEVALIDIGLPDIDGYELARRLRRLPELAGIRLLAITGYATDEHRALAAEAGFDEHMTKPVDLDALLRALERVR